MRLAPDIHRIIMQYAAREDLRFWPAMEILICKGWQAVNQNNPPDGHVENHVQKDGKNL